MVTINLLVKACHRFSGFPRVKSNLFICSSQHLLDSRRVTVNFQYQQRLGVKSFFGVKKRKNYYEILGVPRRAGKKEIKKNYINLAKLYHPDSNSSETSSQEKFQEIQEAYTVLSDDQKRAKYDAEILQDLGTEFKEKVQAKDFNYMKNMVDGNALFRKIFGDLQDNPFAKDEMPQEAKYAETIWGNNPAESLIISLTLEEAAKGCKQEFQIRTVDLCYFCDGTRAAYGFRGTYCQFCDENGYETIATNPIICKIKCRACGGSKEYIKHLCPDCEGKGYQVQMKVVNFNVPPGIRDGEVLKLVIRDQVVYLTCRIKPHEIFHLDGDDIHTINEISISQAALGGKIPVKGVYTNFDLSIPSGTQSHDKIKVPNGGWLKGDLSFGNHIVNVKIKVPEKLSRRQKKIWQEYALLEEDTSGTIDGILDTTQGKKYVDADEKVGFLTRIKRALLG